MATGTLSVYDATAPGWYAPIEQPSVFVDGMGSVLVESLHVMVWTLVSEESGPVYDEEWLRIFDYTAPTSLVQNVSMGWGGEESTGGPYRLEIGWSLSAGYNVDVRVFQWIGSWSLVAQDVVPESAGGFTTDYQFFDGDEVYAEVRYRAIDGTATGPATTTDPHTFTW